MPSNRPSIRRPERDVVHRVAAVGAEFDEPIALLHGAHFADFGEVGGIFLNWKVCLVFMVFDSVPILHAQPCHS